MTSSFPTSQTSCWVSFPLCCSYAEAARILLTLISPIGACKGKTYRGCYENLDLENTDLRPQETQTPEKLRPLGASKTQTPENLTPLGVSKIPTLNIFRILQLTVVREQPLSLSHPQKRMVLQKYRLSENSHRQTISTKPNFWSRAMKFCSNRWTIRL